MLSIFAALAAAAASPATKAFSDPAAANLADLRCVMVFAVGAADAQNDRAKAQGATSGLLYYLGRIDARDPAYDVKGGLIRLLNDPDYEGQVAVYARRCGAELAKRGSEIMAIGNALKGVGSGN